MTAAQEECCNDARPGSDIECLSAAGTHRFVTAMHATAHEHDDRLARLAALICEPGQLSRWDDPEELPGFQSKTFAKVPGRV